MSSLNLVARDWNWKKRLGEVAKKSWRRVVVGLRSVGEKGEGLDTEKGGERERVIFCDAVVLANLVEKTVT